MGRFVFLFTLMSACSFSPTSEFMGLSIEAKCEPVKKYKQACEKRTREPVKFPYGVGRYCDMAVSPTRSHLLCTGIRFGLAMFLSSIFIYTAIFCIVGYFKVIKTGQIFWSELVLSAFSALIGPCRIFQRKSKMLFLSSVLSVFNHFLLIGGLLITLHVNPSIWNQSKELRQFTI